MGVGDPLVVAAALERAGALPVLIAADILGGRCVELARHSHHITSPHNNKAGADPIFWVMH
jgi:hypothetical protein